MSLVEDVRDAMKLVTEALPGGEHRPGQLTMAEAVAEALESEHHLLVEAGTGIGKSFAYLMPAILSGQRIVVATATKALQDQLLKKDVPFLIDTLDVPVDVAVLKGRTNYLCRARLAEALEDGPHDHQLKLVASTTVDEVVPALGEWAGTAAAGEREDLPVDVPRVLWDALTVGPHECPGSRHCAHAEQCFAERARHRAREADLVVVNTHLYCLDLAASSGLVGEHDAVIVDEGHTLEEVASAAFGLTLGPGRFRWLGAQLKGLLVREAGEIEAVERLGGTFGQALDPFAGRRVDASDAGLAGALTSAGEVLGSVLAVLRDLDVTGSAENRRVRVLQAADSLARELQAAADLPEGHVAWVENGEGVNLRVAPVDVGPLLDERLFEARPVVVTSATLSVGGRVEPTARTLGLRDAPGHRWQPLRVTSPFDYHQQGILYCAAHLPDPRDDGFLEAATDELSVLVEAAGGRTLALFTSYRALHAVTDAVRDRWPWEVLVQDEAPRHRLLEEFREDEHSCLFATLAFWQGVDVPGDAVRLVVIDKLPFSRPDEPLTQARREAADADGRRGFEAVDLPRAARLLAQGSGRLIRSRGDRGVVAVLDRRLARAAYRRAILDSMPELRRSVDRDDVCDFLRMLGA